MEARNLTHDEKKAAEAAFRGLPFDSKWSNSAREVYNGLREAMVMSHVIPEPSIDSAASAEQRDSVDSIENVPSQVDEPKTEEVFASTVGSGGEAEAGDDEVQTLSHEEALEAGYLIDVSSLARDMGLDLPVSVTKPLWELGTSETIDFSEEEQRSRIRDILMALRLHLNQSSDGFAVTQFPALLTFPPDPVPQLCAISAVVHTQSPTKEQSLTLLLPEELSNNNPPEASA